MAAIAIPIISAVVPTLIPLLVNEAEKLFGPKTGSTKNAVVTNAVSSFLNAAATAGKLGGPAPPIDQISAIVSQIAGQLFPSGSTAPSPPNSLPTTGSNTTALPPLPSAPADLKQLMRELLIWALSN